MRTNRQPALSVKLTVFLFAAVALSADSKSEKALAAKVSQLESTLKDAANERMADEKRYDERFVSLQRENARIATENNGYRGKIVGLNETITELQAKLAAQLSASKFEASAVKVLADHATTSEAAVAAAGAAVKVANIAAARHVDTSKALDRNADITQQLSGEITALRGLIAQMATNQISDHDALLRHGQLLEHQAKMGSWLVWLTCVVAGIFLAIVAAIIYYLRVFHE